MIIDSNFRLTYIRDKVFEELHDPLKEMGFKLNRQLVARKKLKDEFITEIYFHFTDYFPFNYQLWFNGAVTQKSLVEPIKKLFNEIRKSDFDVAHLNYSSNFIFHISDFIAELHNLPEAMRKSFVYEFDSIEILDEKLKELRKLLVDDVLPSINVLTDYNKLTQDLATIIEKFREEWVNVSSLLAFACIYDKDNFHTIFKQVEETTIELKKRGQPVSTFFNYLPEVKGFFDNYVETTRVD